MEASMKLTVPGVVLAALIVAAPVAFAQNTGYSGTTSKPGASVAKDDQTTGMTKHSKKHTASYSKKHTASYKHRHHAKAMSSKAQTTGSGSSSAPGASINKDDTTPMSK
jgi:hypothetical protein